VHLAPHTLEYIRHAVLGDEDGGPPRRRPLVEQRAHLPVIGFEDLGAPRRYAFGGEADVAGISMCSPMVGIEVATAGSRLQSITSRE